MEKYKGMTDEELIASLKKYNIPHGPILKTTRKLYEKKMYEFESQRKRMPPTEVTCDDPDSGSHLYRSSRYYDSPTVEQHSRHSYPYEENDAEQMYEESFSTTKTYGAQSSRYRGTQEVFDSGNMDIEDLKCKRRQLFREAKAKAANTAPEALSKVERVVLGTFTREALHGVGHMDTSGNSAAPGDNPAKEEKENDGEVARPSWVADGRPLQGKKVAQAASQECREHDASDRGDTAEHQDINPASPEARTALHVQRQQVARHHGREGDRLVGVAEHLLPQSHRMLEIQEQRLGLQERRLQIEEQRLQLEQRKVVQLDELRQYQRRDNELQEELLQHVRFIANNMAALMAMPQHHPPGVSSSPHVDHTPVPPQKRARPCEAAAADHTTSTASTPRAGRSTLSSSDSEGDFGEHAQPPSPPRQLGRGDRGGRGKGRGKGKGRK